MKIKNSGVFGLKADSFFSFSSSNPYFEFKESSESEKSKEDEQYLNATQFRWNLEDEEPQTKFELIKTSFHGEDSEIYQFDFLLKYRKEEEDI